MSINKNQLRRICLIDAAIRSIYCPTKQDLLQYVKEAMTGDYMDAGICASTLEKDMVIMRVEYDAPLKFNRSTCCYNYTDPEYEFWKVFLQHWGLFIDFPSFIKQKIYE